MQPIHSCGKFCSDDTLGCQRCLRCPLQSVGWLRRPHLPTETARTRNGRLCVQLVDTHGKKTRLSLLPVFSLCTLCPFLHRQTAFPIHASTTAADKICFFHRLCLWWRWLLLLGHRFQMWLCGRWFCSLLRIPFLNDSPFDLQSILGRKKKCAFCGTWGCQPNENFEWILADVFIRWYIPTASFAGDKFIMASFIPKHSGKLCTPVKTFYIHYDSLLEYIIQARIYVMRGFLAVAGKPVFTRLNWCQCSDFSVPKKKAPLAWKATPSHASILSN